MFGSLSKQAPNFVVPSLVGRSTIPTNFGLVSLEEIYHCCNKNKYYVSQSMYPDEISPSEKVAKAAGPNYIESVDLFKNQRVYQVETVEGFTLKCGLYTGFNLVNGQVKLARDLTPGDKLSIQNNFHFWGNLKISKDDLFNVGNDIFKVLDDPGAGPVQYLIPDYVLKSPYQDLHNLIKGIYQETQGNIEYIQSVHRELLAQIQLLFLNMGIKTYMFHICDNIFRLRRSPRDFDDSWNYAVFTKLKPLKESEDMYRPRLALDHPSGKW